MAKRDQALNFCMLLASPLRVDLRWVSVLGMLILALALTSTGCSSDAEYKPEQFVGNWKTSRMNSRPVHLMANGEWEIRPEDGGKPLQFGVWEVKGRVLTWTIRLNDQLTHDRNRIESYAPNRFTLREQDGSLTIFDRLN